MVNKDIQRAPLTDCPPPPHWRVCGGSWARPGWRDRRQRSVADPRMKWGRIKNRGKWRGRPCYPAHPWLHPHRVYIYT